MSDISFGRNRHIEIRPGVPVSRRVYDKRPIVQFIRRFHAVQKFDVVERKFVRLVVLSRRLGKRVRQVRMVEGRTARPAERPMIGAT